MPSPKISVIIPIYNVEPFLRRCLDSVINNTYGNLEIICVNDGSTDNCLSILREYEKRDPRIIVIDKKNNGLSAARNTGMDIASGEFIAFIDSDDWIHPRYFETLLHFQQLTHSDITIGRSVRTAQEQSFDPLDFDAITYQTLNADGLLSMYLTKTHVWGRLYRHELVRHHRFVEGMLFEDTPFNITLMLEHEEITGTLISAPLYAYFIRPTSIVHTANPMKRLETCYYYLKIVFTVSSSRKKAILLCESIKKALSCRYTLSLLRCHDDVKACNAVLHESLRLLMPLSCVSPMSKMCYTTLTTFPMLYRIFRIVDDPTMLSWERSIRAQHKDN